MLFSKIVKKLVLVAVIPAGSVTTSDVPSCAPAMVYVVTPDGSSSAAPVIRPGPKTEKNRRMKFFRFGCFVLFLLIAVICRELSLPVYLSPKHGKCR